MSFVNRSISIGFAVLFSQYAHAGTVGGQSSAELFSTSSMVTSATFDSVGYDADGYRVYRFTNAQNIKGKSANNFSLRSEIRLVIQDENALKPTLNLIKKRDNTVEEIHTSLTIFDKSDAALKLRELAESEAQAAAAKYTENMDPSKGDIPAGKYGVYYGKISELSPYLFGGVEPDAQFYEGTLYVLFHNSVDLPIAPNSIFRIINGDVYSSISHNNGRHLAISGIDWNGNAVITESQSAIPINEFIEKIRFGNFNREVK